MILNPYTTMHGYEASITANGDAGEDVEKTLGYLSAQIYPDNININFSCYDRNLITENRQDFYQYIIDFVDMIFDESETDLNANATNANATPAD